MASPRDESGIPASRSVAVLSSSGSEDEIARSREKDASSESDVGELMCADCLETPNAESLDMSDPLMGEQSPSPSDSKKSSFRYRRRLRKFLRKKKAVRESLPYHTMEAEEVARVLSTNLEHGLTSAETENRLRMYGLNNLRLKGGPTALTLLVKHSATGLTLIMLLSIIVSTVTANYLEAGVVTFILILNVFIGMLQEWRSESAMKALRKLSAPMARVTRDGFLANVAGSMLVVGDLVSLSAGDVIPADIRLTSVNTLRVDESLLTGEAEPVDKETAVIADQDALFMERLNCAYSGCIVTRGRGTGIVVETGMKTQVGAIAKRVSSGEKQTSSRIQTRLEIMTWYLFGASMILGLIVMWVNHFDFSDSVYIVFAVSIAIAIVPECLMVVITLAITINVRKLVRENAIVRRLNALETLGQITDICTDKTGTLTQAKMKVQYIWTHPAAFYDVEGQGIDIIGRITRQPKMATEFLAEYPVAATKDNCDPMVTESYSTPTIIEISTMSALMRQIFLCSGLCNMATIRLIDPDGPPTSKSSSSAHRREGVANDLGGDEGRKLGLRLSIGGDAWEHSFTDPKHRYNYVQGFGDPTEIALQVLAYKVKMGKPSLLAHGYSIEHEYHFDSGLKVMSVVVSAEISASEPPIFVGYLKGAPERVLDCCETYWDGVTHHPLDERFYERFRNVNHFLARRGLRVLGLAFRDPMPPSDMATRATAEQNYAFLGMVGIYDMPRPESRPAIERCRRASITVRMVTGDHLETATAIAKEVDILPPNFRLPSPLAIMARDFEAMSPEQIDLMPDLPLVLARCTPDSKVRLIQALYRKRRVVAMTGDGVNDAPALNIANIGVAMGKSGSDVARQASDVILLDDNFATVVTAVIAGRRIIDNLYKFLAHLLSANIAEVVVLIIGLVFHRDDRSIFTLSTLQILWLNVTTSSFPAIGLGVEAVDRRVMERPPVSERQSLFFPEMIFDVLYYGTLQGLISLSSFSFVLFFFAGGTLGQHCNKITPESVDCGPVLRARAITFNMMTVTILYHALNCKHFTAPIWTMDHLRNPTLLCSIVSGVMLSLLVTYIPKVHDNIFTMGQMEAADWLVLIAGLLAFAVASEAYKWFKRSCLNNYNLRSWEHFIRRCRGKETTAKEQSDDASAAPDTPNAPDVPLLSKHKD